MRGIASSFLRGIVPSSLVLLNLLSVSADNCPVLSWSDEFNGNQLDESAWTPQIGDGCDRGIDLCGWGNNEEQWYRGENAIVSDGTLKIMAKRETFGSPPKQFTSSRIRTFQKVEIDLTKDTLIEGRIKVPSGGQGLWPAFWMMPTPEVEWPSGGEIDIMEFIGREPFFPQGYIHYGPEWGDKLDAGGPIRLPDPVYENFHTFSIVKTENQIDWFVDGHKFQSYSSADIEPKYSWPFERRYHFLLNVAVGGNWPGSPDETSMFPTSMEVDYIRVYELTEDSVVYEIVGTRLVHQNSAEIEYCVTPAPEGDITWTVPQGSTFKDSSFSGCILVTFGRVSGYVKASVETDCFEEEASVELSVPVEVQPFYGVESTVIDPSIPLDFSSGENSLMTIDGLPTIKYTRSSDLYDYFFMNFEVPDPNSFFLGVRKFYMDVKSITAAPCTRVLIQLEDSNLATPTNYPVGRHSRYQCLIEPTKEWQRITCDFEDRPDRSVINVNRIAVLLDASLSRSDVYHLRNLDISRAGCTANCEALQSNGASTSNCRRKAKSEEGACNDGINNNFEGYDGNLVGDCDDPKCFLIAPECGGPVFDTPPTTPPAPITLAPISPTPASIPATPAPIVNGNSMTASPISISTVPPVSFIEVAECSLNTACVGLADACCPTSDGVYLYCCFEDKPEVQYEKEFVFVGPQVEGQQAIYLESSENYDDDATAPDGSSPVVSYTRGSSEVYDLIYFNTAVINNANDYVSGNKKILLDVYSQADECTQIMIQFDSLPMANSTNFPTGRHSRYLAFTTTSNAWERIEFDFLDRPDGVMSDTLVNAIVLFFNPGATRSNTFFFRNMDSAISGCTGNCEQIPVKSCQAIFEGEDGSCEDGIDNDSDGLIDCEDPECMLSDSCSFQLTRSFISTKSLLRAEEINAASDAPKGIRRLSLGLAMIGTILFASA